MMKVCIDIQAGVSQRAGIGRYVSELVGHLPRTDDLDFELFYMDFKGKAKPPRAPHCTFRRFSKVPGLFVQQAWKHFSRPSFNTISGRYDLFHFPNFIIPPLDPRAGAVVSIHDISFLLHPDFAESRNLDFLTRRIEKTVRRANAIITISRKSADDICERLSVEKDRVHPVYLGVSKSFCPASAESVSFIRDALLLDRPYILMVGTFEPRKNIPFAIDLFEKMSFFDGDLVLVGQKGWKNEAIFKRISASPAKERIHTFAALPDSFLPSLYSGAELLLMTSFYEGFGFPPVEAMACGTPVVSSDGGSLAEICADAAVVISGYDKDEWLARTEQLFASADLKAALCKAGLRRAADFTWQKTAEEHVSLYRKVI